MNQRWSTSRWLCGTIPLLQCVRAAVCVFAVTSVVLSVPLIVRPARADEPIEKYFDGLRERRMFRLAEGYCLERLASDSLPEQRRLTLTLELSRTFAEHAKFTTGDEQDELWDLAGSTVDDFLQKAPDHREALVLRVQRALVPAAKGEFLAAQVDLFPHNDDVKQRSREALSDAIERLRGLIDPLESLRRKAASSQRGADLMPPHELKALVDQTRFQIGYALLNRAKLSPLSSPDRTSALIDAEKWLRDAAGGAPDETLTWRARVAVAESKRLLGNFKAADGALMSIYRDSPPREIRDLVVAQRVRLMLDAGDVADAAKLLVEYRQVRGALPGELEYLKAAVLMKMWEVARREKKSELADNLLKQLRSNVERTEQQIGGYWGYRARQLLRITGDARQYGPELARIVRKAESLYHAGRIDESLAEYRKAADDALKSGDRNAAMELGYTRASILLHAGRVEEAARDFGTLVEQFPKSPKVGAASLLRSYSLGGLYNSERTSARREAYLQSLVDHRKKFKDDPTAVDAAWMLARYWESRLQWNKAKPLYEEIPADHKYGFAAQAAVARGLKEYIHRSQDDAAARTAWENEAVRVLSAYIDKYPAPPESWSPEQASVAVQLAEVQLHRNRPEYDAANRLLGRIFESRDADQDPANAEAWRTVIRTAAQYRIVALAGKGDVARGRDLLESFAGDKSVDLLDVLDGLGRLAEQSDAPTRRRLGELQLAAARDLDKNRESLSEADRLRLDQSLAEAYAVTGRSAQAIAVYRRVLESKPRDPAVLRAAAELLTRCGTRECLTEAQTVWRRLEGVEKPGSGRWLDARYHVAFTARQLGRDAEARKLLAVTKLLYPNLGGGERRDRFEKLSDAVKR